ncbi:hypothetical protein P879_07975 [Paragonimus westermani]|uniref:Uncharacterized protein n=1 Tax=Paragonimus westermani TaxID=34504 RepID=A0A8T0DSW2_9TREM|nr:hypothetical protein P879_07975 [Paragonimus westermani]
MEVELEKKVVEADRLAEITKVEDKRKIDREKKNEMMRSMTEQQAQRINKHQAECAEKEDSHRIIRELVQKENEKVAAELAAKRFSREAIVSDYRHFIACQKEKKARLLQEQLAQEDKLRQEQQAINERRDRVEQERKANVNARIQMQEAVGQYTNALQATYEKERLAFLEANETIASSKASLAEYNMKRDQEVNRREMLEQKRQEWENLLEYRRKIKEEEQELEKRLDQMNMEVINKEANDRNAKKLAVQARKKEEMLDQIEKTRQQHIKEALDKRQEEVAYLNRQVEYQQLVDTERKSMLDEYAEYLNTLDESPTCEKKEG